MNRIKTSYINMLYEDIGEMNIDEDPDIKEALKDLYNSIMSEKQLEVVWRLTFHILYAMKGRDNG